MIRERAVPPECAPVGEPRERRGRALGIVHDESLRQLSGSAAYESAIRGRAGYRGGYGGGYSTGYSTGYRGWDKVGYSMRGARDPQPGLYLQSPGAGRVEADGDRGERVVELVQLFTGQMSAPDRADNILATFAAYGVPRSCRFVAARGAFTLCTHLCTLCIPCILRAVGRVLPRPGTGGQAPRPGTDAGFRAG